MKSRSIRGEDGFTLPEMMVTIMVMIIVLFALYSIFDMSIRVYAFGNNKVEAVENARAGLEKMEREIRAAYPYNKGGIPADTHLLDTMAPSEIAFGNDTENANYKVDTSEIIRYRLSGPSGNDNCDPGEKCKVMRSKGGSAYQPVVESVRAPNSSTSPAYGGGLRFTYLKGTVATTNTADEPSITAVRIELDVSVDEGTRYEGKQTLTTEVALRNRDETATSTQPACGDGVDNDTDGKVDLADPGCTSTTDNDETDSTPSSPLCSDGNDNDGDSKTDYSDLPGEGDPGCTSATDNDESDPPNTIIDSGPSGSVTSTSATFTFRSDPTGATFECSIDNGAWTPCTSPKTYSSLSISTHTFKVKATNAAGTDSTPDSRTWTITNTAPNAKNDTATVKEKGAVNIDVINGSTPGAVKDTDADGDTLFVQSFSQPSKGKVEFGPNGTLTFTPNNGSKAGETFTFTYLASDGKTVSSPATVTVTVTN